MGTTMAAAGIDFDLAPVVDLDVNPKNPAGRRSRAQLLCRSDHRRGGCAEAEIRGLHSQGIKAVHQALPGPRQCVGEHGLRERST